MSGPQIPWKSILEAIDANEKQRDNALWFPIVVLVAALCAVFTTESDAAAVWITVPMFALCLVFPVKVGIADFRLRKRLTTLLPNGSSWSIPGGGSATVKRVGTRTLCFDLAPGTAVFERTDIEKLAKSG